MKSHDSVKHIMIYQWGPESQRTIYTNLAIIAVILQRQFYRR